jgi:hypothetical protein
VIPIAISPAPYEAMRNRLLHQQCSELPVPEQLSRSVQIFCPQRVVGALTSVALFDLRSNGGIIGLKGRPRPWGAASGPANEREQDEENAKCSPIVGHRSPIRVSQLAARLCNHFGEDQSALASLKITSL